MKKVLKHVPKKIKQEYRVDDYKKEVHIHEPAYINIDKDVNFRISQSERTLRIGNSKIIVTLWKNIKNMHVTIL